jgi:hypothetical protein
MTPAHLRGLEREPAEPPRLNYFEQTTHIVQVSLRYIMPEVARTSDIQEARGNGLEVGV